MFQQLVVARPTSAVKPVNVSSKVDSGLVRAGPGRTPVLRGQRAHSPGGANRGQQRSHSPGGANRGQQRSHSPGAGLTRGHQRSHSPGAGVTRGHRRSQSPGSGVSRGHQRSQSAGPIRKNSLQHRQVASLKPTSASSVAATPEMARKQPGGNINNLADDEASDTENELR